MTTTEQALRRALEPIVEMNPPLPMGMIEDAQAALALPSDATKANSGGVGGPSPEVESRTGDARIDALAEKHLRGFWRVEGSASGSNTTVGIDGLSEFVRAVLDLPAPSVAEPSDAEIAEVWGRYDEGHDTRAGLIARILARWGASPASVQPAPASPLPVSEADIIKACEAVGMKWCGPDDEEDGFPGAFDMPDMASMQRLFAALGRKVAVACESCFSKGVEGTADDYGHTVAVECGNCEGKGWRSLPPHEVREDQRFRQKCRDGHRCLQGCYKTESCYHERRAALSASQAHDKSYSIDADPSGIRARTADAITGALAFGAQNTNPPPAGHWLATFWEMARAERVQTHGKSEADAADTTGAKKQTTGPDGQTTGAAHGKSEPRTVPDALDEACIRKALSTSLSDNEVPFALRLPVFDDFLSRWRALRAQRPATPAAASTDAPAGFKLVPVEPTAAMLEAVAPDNLTRPGHERRDVAAALYRAMLAAAPAPVAPLGAVPAFFVRDRDVAALADPRVASRGAGLHKEASDGMSPFYATPQPAPAQPDAADAARYRWMRENAHPMDGSIQVLEEPENDGPCNHLYGVYLDAAIDAALALQAKAKGGERG